MSICSPNELPLMLRPQDIQQLMGGISRKWATVLMERGEAEGFYALARIGNGKNARLRVHRDKFLSYLERDKEKPQQGGQVKK